LMPLELVGAFSGPGLAPPRLVERGMAFSNWESGKLFGWAHPAATFPDSEVSPFEKFPRDRCDVFDPEGDLQNWTLGEVKKASPHTLFHIQALPKVDRKSRHLWVEACRGCFWRRTPGRFPGAPRWRCCARFVEVGCADDYESINIETVECLR
jgi:hypothetical protein